jgi:hypothetical protein
MNSIKVILTILFIVLYFWASKIVDTEEIIGIKKYSGLLGHTEGATNWVLDSNVCLLGKIVFSLWTIVVLINLVFSINKKLLFFLAFLTILITAILNMPLFIRAIPAFIILLVLIRTE